MINESQIKETETYKNIVHKTPFLKNILLKPSSRNNIERYIYQIKLFGIDYLNNKNYCDREVKIAKEIFLKCQSK